MRLRRLVSCGAPAWVGRIGSPVLPLALVLLALVAAGAARYGIAVRKYEANALHNYDAADYVDVEGRLIASPGREPDRDVLLIRVDSLRDRGVRRAVAGNLRLTVPFAPETHGRLRLHARDRVRASVKLSMGEGFRNFDSFSYGTYLRNQGIHRRASTKSSLLVEWLKPGGRGKVAGTDSPPAKADGGSAAADVDGRSRGNSRSLADTFLGAVSRIRCKLQETLEARFPGSGVAAGLGLGSGPASRSDPASGAASARTDISPEGAILEALLLGEDGRMDPETVLSLQQTGLYHLFAISGGHIAIISLLLFGALKLARVPQRGRHAILIVFLVFYTLLVEASPSVLRATVMALAFCTGKLLWKDVDILNTISFSAFGLLLANPFSLFDAGFQLTYAATLAIIVFCPRMMKRLPKLPLGLAEMTAMSAAAVAGVLPIIVRNFNRVTFASLILNYAAIPLVGVIMGAGYVFLPAAAMAGSGAVMTGGMVAGAGASGTASLGAGMAMAATVGATTASAALGAGPGWVGLAAEALRLLVSLFARISHLLDGVSVLSFRVPTPHGWTIAGYYACLLLLMVPARGKWRGRLAAGGLAAFGAILVLYPFPARSKTLKLTMIDVGQGDALLVEFPGTTKMLIDGGGLVGSTFDVGERVISPVLWSKGIKRVDILVLTHAHPDHVNGLAAVARNFRVREFWEAAGTPPARAFTTGSTITGAPGEPGGAKQSATKPPTRRVPGWNADAAAGETGYANLIAALSENVVRRRVGRGFIYRIGEVIVEALHPAPEETGVSAGTPAVSEAAANDASLVLKISSGRASILLAGDIGRAAEREIIEAGLDLRSTVIKVPHHGSGTSSSELFLARVRPELALMSVGEGNRYGFPHPAVLARYAAAGARVLRTDLCGAIELTFGGGPGENIDIKCVVHVSEASQSLRR